MIAFNSSQAPYGSSVPNAQLGSPVRLQMPQYGNEQRIELRGGRLSILEPTVHAREIKYSYYIPWRRRASNGQLCSKTGREILELNVVFRKNSSSARFALTFRQLSTQPFSTPVCELINVYRYYESAVCYSLTFNLHSITKCLENTSVLIRA